MGRAGRWTGATVQGWVARAQHLGSSGETNPDDATLADRVETEVFRDSDVPKGRMNVNVENGIVVVRGTVDDQALISTIERRIQRIPGVAGVRNLLHLTGTPAPTSAERSTASASR
jgi:osmotically-inducible protein OsmY